MLKGLGGMGDMMGLMKQAQKMKKDMKKIKKDISKTNITVSDKNNMITLVINGDYVIPVSYTHLRAHETDSYIV